jgi:hypothetical protein
MLLKSISIELVPNENMKEECATSEYTNNLLKIQAEKFLIVPLIGKHLCFQIDERRYQCNPITPLRHRPLSTDDAHCP